MRHKGLILWALIGALIGLFSIYPSVLTVKAEFDFHDWLIALACIFGFVIVGMLLGGITFFIKKKLAGWKIGAMMGFAVGLFSFLVFLNFPPILMPVLFIINLLNDFFNFIPANWGEWGMLGAAAYGAPVIYALIGALIGFLVQTTRSILRGRRNDR